jgi:hypothetical protein
MSAGNPSTNTVDRDSAIFQSLLKKHKFADALKFANKIGVANLDNSRVYVQEPYESPLLYVVTLHYYVKCTDHDALCWPLFEILQKTGGVTREAALQQLHTDPNVGGSFNGLCLATLSPGPIFQSLFDNPLFTITDWYQDHGFLFRLLLTTRRWYVDNSEMNETELATLKSRFQLLLNKTDFHRHYIEFNLLKYLIKISLEAGRSLLQQRNPLDFGHWLDAIEPTDWVIEPSLLKCLADAKAVWWHYHANALITLHFDLAFFTNQQWLRPLSVIVSCYLFHA